MEIARIIPVYGEHYLIHTSINDKFYAYYIGKTKRKNENEDEEMQFPYGHLFVYIDENDKLNLYYTDTIEKDIHLSYIGSTDSACEYIGFAVKSYDYTNYFSSLQEKYIRELIERKVNEKLQKDAIKAAFQVIKNSVYGVINHSKDTDFVKINNDRFAEFVFKIHELSKEEVKKILFFDTKMCDYSDVSNIIPVYNVKSKEQLIEYLEIGLKTKEYKYVIITDIMILCNNSNTYQQISDLFLNMNQLAREYKVTIIC